MIKDFDFEINGYSYMRIEQKTKGHEWHNAQGGYTKDDDNLHMKWCQVGVSILLSD